MKNKTLIIDFDSTFIQTEALDELAKIALRAHLNYDLMVEQIRQLTAAGMEGHLSLQESLLRRLALLHAHQSHLETLIHQLQQQISLSFKRHAAFLKQNADHIYIVSNGFKEYIIPVISPYLKTEHVLANTFLFDAEGYIIGLDQSNPLSQDQGKVVAVKNLQLKDEVWVIGDGITDYQLREQNVAQLFFAFTENISRASVVAKADVILTCFDDFLTINNYPSASKRELRETQIMESPPIKILLLENIHPHGVQLLQEQGYIVETLPGSLSEAVLCERIKDVNILGIRSKTQVTEKILAHAEQLIAIGAFCIGTNQIDLAAATAQGICVFNAPYSNTRSVVEMVIGEIIMLMRKVVVKNNALHRGQWDKSADHCYEVRGKKLGIIGYGNIGSQLSVLAEALGMQVYYYDLIEKLQLGNAKKCNHLNELLAIADIVTVHVDGRLENEYMIGRAQFAQMKEQVVFINLSRGHVVDIHALVEALHNGKILGAAIDVFPEEPSNNKEPFHSPLCGFENVILSPHIGGSTEEAQCNISEFVARRLISYVKAGDSTQSINLPNIQLPEIHNAHRLIHLHANVPGILAQINQVLANHHVNLLGQYLKTNEQIGYVFSDVSMDYDKKLHQHFRNIKHTIKSRILY